MVICGIKFTHDGSIAVIDNGQLKFSIEIEKLENNGRYSEIDHVELIPKILAANGYEISQIDRFVIDGWDARNENNHIFCDSAAGKLSIPVGSYQESGLNDSILHRECYEASLPIAGKKRTYSSYTHVAAHVIGTYCASPFAAKNENSYVLAWDGGLYPRLYHINAAKKEITNKGPLFNIRGTIYSIIALYVGPYKKSLEEIKKGLEMEDLNIIYGGLSAAGKIMSFMGKGQIQKDLQEELPNIYKRELEPGLKFEHKFCSAIYEFAKHKPYTAADILLTVHHYLKDKLIEGLSKKINADELGPGNLCFCGGSALNIKWNSAIRASRLFKAMFVPPFPNDTGSALGAAACEMWVQSSRNNIDWQVFSGPKIIKNNPAEGWKETQCTLSQLARLLHESNEPVVVLNDRAAIGPRALGHRSIIAAATSAQMKDILNEIKGRESFRPVAPICLEEYAGQIFSPGTKDEFMLFDHLVKETWKKKIPAVCHIDGTARLQTVSKDNPFVYNLLTAYHKCSGVPVLCNTSANLNGSGFFPDVKSATQWGKVNYVWCEGSLYTKS